MLPRMIPRMARKLNRQVGVPDLDAAGQARLGIQAPGVVELIVFLVVGFFERGAALAHMHIQTAQGLDAQSIRSQGNMNLSVGGSVQTGAMLALGN